MAATRPPRSGDRAARSRSGSSSAGAARSWLRPAQIDAARGRGATASTPSRTSSAGSVADRRPRPPPRDARRARAPPSPRPAAIAGSSPRVAGGRGVSSIQATRPSKASPNDAAGDLGREPRLADAAETGQDDDAPPRPRRGAPRGRGPAPPGRRADRRRRAARHRATRGARSSDAVVGIAAPSIRGMPVEPRLRPVGSPPDGSAVRRVELAGVGREAEAHLAGQDAAMAEGDTVRRVGGSPVSRRGRSRSAAVAFE